MNICGILQEQAERYPDRIAWEDEERTYSFSEIEDLSGRIYRYLKDGGIGKEDIVALRLPRSGKIPVVWLGVWKAGAAFLTIGEQSPEDYVARQLKEAEPERIFTLTDFESAVNCEYLGGYETPGEHDLAFVVYSTGSTGRFKGSMHEYGAISKAIRRTGRFWADYAGNTPDADESRVMFSSGFYTVSALVCLLDSVISGYYFYIVPRGRIGKTEGLGEILTGKRISCYTATGRDFEYVRALNSPYLKELCVSLDMNSAPDCRDYVSYNYYGMSESLCILTCFKVDRPYDIVPIGKAPADTPMMIADKNGSRVGDGTVGELCFVPEYWRGYIAHPEKTAAAYYDGWFHTGDMAYVNEDGNFVIVGRKIDIAETENGLIVPAFIEAAFRKAFPDAEKCHVQIFGSGEEPLICLYYIGAADYSAEEVRRALSAAVPEYCLPAYCVKMKEFIYFPSGKLNRNTFPNPEEKPVS